MGHFRHGVVTLPVEDLIASQFGFPEVVLVRSRVVSPKSHCVRRFGGIGGLRCRSAAGTRVRDWVSHGVAGTDRNCDCCSQKASNRNWQWLRALSDYRSSVREGVWERETHG